MKQNTLALWLKSNIFHLLIIATSGLAMLFYLSEIVVQLTTTSTYAHPVFMLISTLILAVPFVYSLCKVVTCRKDEIFFVSGTELFFKFLIFMLYVFAYYLIFALFYFIITL